MAQVSGSTLTPESAKNRRKFLIDQMTRALAPTPVQGGWVEALARVGTAGLLGWQQGQLDQEEGAARAASEARFRSSVEAASGEGSSSIPLTPDRSTGVDTVTSAYLGQPKPPTFAGGDSARPMSMPADPAIEQRFIGELRNGGLTNPHGLGAMAAYAAAESGYKPGNITGSWSDPSERGEAGTSGGILSWRGPRLAAMQSFTQGQKDPVTAQAQFALSENPELTAALQNAKSPEEAHGLMANAWRFAGFNRPGGENERRLGMTRSYVAKLGGGENPADMLAAGAQAAQGFAIPGEPERNANGDITRLLAGIVSDPWLSPEQKAFATTLAKDRLGGETKTIDLGDSVGVLDRRGNMVQRIPKAEQPTFGPVGKDPNTGEEVMGWRNPRSQTVTPYQPQGSQPAGPSTLPPVPPGVDPEVWRETHSKREAERLAAPKFEDVTGLRKEVSALPSVKNFNTVAPIYQSITQSFGKKSRAADLDFVYGIGKIFDPDSVVREGEMVMVNNAQALPDKLLGAINQLKGGQMLQEDVRRELLDVARTRVVNLKGAAEGDTGRYRGIVERNGMRAEDVLPIFGDVPELPTATPPAGAKAPAGQKPAAATPKLGEVMDDHVFLGGDPSDPWSWAKKR